MPSTALLCVLKLQACHLWLSSLMPAVTLCGAYSRVITGSGTSINQLLAALNGLPVLLLWCACWPASHACAQSPRLLGHGGHLQNHAWHC